MKKLTLTLSLLFATLLSMQAQVIFYEDFDGISGPTAGGAGTYTFPSGWFLRNVDNRTPDAQVAYVNEAWERREDFNFNVGDSCAFSTSWYSPVGAANDFMWTPMIGPLPANTVLSWNAVTYDPSYPDGYEVRIMTTAPTGGTGVIGNQITNSTVLFTIAAENSAWTARSVNLSAYAGQSVYIGFRNMSTDKFLLCIDDIKLEVQVNIDLELLFADTATEYTLIPQTQTAALNFNGTIRNNGLNTLSNASAQVNVYNGTTNVYSATSVGGTLVSGSTATWTVPSFTPSGAGVYTVEYIALQSSGTDQLPTNDTMWQTFIVTDSTYARDDGTVTGSLGVGAGNGYLGQTFVVSNTDLLTSIGMYVTRGYTGRNMGLCVWNTDAQGVPTTILVTTDTMQYPDDSADYYVFTLTNGPLMLNPGTYVVTAIEFDSTLALGTTNNLFTANKTWVDWSANPIAGWANNEDFNFSVSYVIRPNFGDVCLNNAVALSSTQSSCISCADGSATAVATGTDGTVTYNWAPAGGNAATATGLTTGVYTVTVTDGYGCVTMDTITVGYDVCGLVATSTVSADASCGICADGSAQVTVTGANGTVTYLWSNGGTSDTIQNVLPGTYYVTITDSLGCTAMDSVVVNFSTDAAGISNPGAVTVFPNPNNGTFQVNVSLGQSTDLTLYITNVLGEVVATKTVAGIQNGMIDMNAGLSAGAYLLHVRSTDSEKVIPVTVQ
jgi:hypothetical protein